MSSWDPEGPRVGGVGEATVIEAFVDPDAGGGVETWVGNGDDAAVFAPRAGLGVVVTKDDFVEEVHFTRALIDPERLGARLVAINVSDVAAMGGRPRHLFLSVALPRTLSMKAVEALGRGVLRRCRAEGVTVLGGNVSRSPGPIFLSATLTGEVERGRWVLRSGAGTGDDIWMTGSAGRAAAGLALGLRRGQPGADDPDWALYAAWAEPPSRVAFACRLGGSGWVNAMCDASDGLGTDLPRLLDGRGAELDAGSFSIDPDVRAAAATEGRDPFGFAFSGGEDYELLFMSAPQHRQAIMEAASDLAVPIQRLGAVRAEPGIALRDGDETRALDPGWDHFGGRSE